MRYGAEGFLVNLLSWVALVGSAAVMGSIVLDLLRYLYRLLPS